MYNLCMTKMSSFRWCCEINKRLSHPLSLVYRKALKATAFLFPLLGMNQLIFCFNPRDEDQFEDAYMLINALLQSSQGIIVAILYCFTNTQVKTTIRAAYCRRIMLRDVNSLRINNHHNTNIDLRNSINNQNNNNNNSSLRQCNTDNSNINCNSNVTVKDADDDELNHVTVDCTNDASIINNDTFHSKAHYQSKHNKSSSSLCKKLLESSNLPVSRDTIEEETVADSNVSLTSSKSFEIVTHHNHHFNHHHHHHHHHHHFHSDQVSASCGNSNTATSLVWGDVCTRNTAWYIDRHRHRQRQLIRKTNATSHWIVKHCNCTNHTIVQILQERKNECPLRDCHRCTVQGDTCGNASLTRDM